MSTTICESCGTVIEAGMWAFCPHSIRGQRLSVHTDDIPGGMVLENYGPHPVTVYSYSEAARLRESAGLHLKEKFSPTPGTDIDPAGIPNPKGYVDAQTLANGRDLICRNGQSVERPFDAIGSGVIRDQFSIASTQRDAEAVAAGDPRRSSRIGRRLHGRK